MMRYPRPFKRGLLLRSIAVLALVLAWSLGWTMAGGSFAHAAPAVPARGALSFQPSLDSHEVGALEEITLPASAMAADIGPDGSGADLAHQVVYLTNLERARYGLLPLKANDNLMAAALSHSRDMAENDFFGHTSSDGGTLVNRFVAHNYLNWVAGAENIAAGFSTADAVMAAWMASSGHRNNILNPNLREIGVGYFYQPNDQPNVRLPDGSLGGPYFHYWTQDFGARYNVYPVIINLEAATTTTRQVTLAIHGQGWAQQMQVSNRPDFAGAQWEPFAPTRVWQLEPGNGTRTVYVKLRNAYGQEVISSDEIELVGQPEPTATPQPTSTPTATPTPVPTATPTQTPAVTLPAARVTINNGQPFTNQTRVTLNLELPAAARQLEIANNPGFSPAQTLPVQPQVTWELDGGLIGVQWVYVRYRDAYGVASPTSSAQIIYDPLPPVGQVRIIANNGLSLLVDVTARDSLSGISAMAVGLNPDDLSWQFYMSPIKLAVPAGSQASEPVVYARFRDQAGNESPLYRSDQPASQLQAFIPLVTR